MYIVSSKQDPSKNKVETGSVWGLSFSFTVYNLCTLAGETTGHGPLLGKSYWESHFVSSPKAMELRRRLLTTTFFGGAVSSTCNKVDVHGLEIVAVTKMVDECVGRSTREERVLQVKGFWGKHATCGALVLVYKMLSRTLWHTEDHTLFFNYAKKKPFYQTGHGFSVLLQCTCMLGSLFTMLIKGQVINVSFLFFEKTLQS